MSLMSSVTSGGKVLLVKWWHVAARDCVCPWHGEENRGEELETLQTLLHEKLIRFTVSSSAWQGTTEWNTAVSPKVASTEVFTGIHGYIFLCADAWRRWWGGIKGIADLLQFHTIVKSLLLIPNPFLAYGHLFSKIYQVNILTALSSAALQTRSSMALRILKTCSG